jgi:hypothetical protein
MGGLFQLDCRYVSDLFQRGGQLTAFWNLEVLESVAYIKLSCLSRLRARAGRSKELKNG